jgi:glycerophosphoryl diester phosphodiesterase
VPALIRVGHRGAPAVAEDNTLASFDAALAIGVDMIEFDVLPGRGESRELYVAHDDRALDESRSLTLAAALAHFASPAFAGVRLQLDIKRSGVEQDVLAALDAGVTRERAFITTGERGVLRRFRELAPELALGWTVGDLPRPLAATTLGRRHRERLAASAAALIRAREIDAVVAHWRVVTPALVNALLGAGGEIYAWTVDDAPTIARLAALGVTGVITNDPRLFAVIEQTEAL